MNLNKTIQEEFESVAKELKNKIKKEVKKAIVAGSGIANSIPNEKILQKIPYSEIKLFPKVTVEGHKDELILYEHNNKVSLIFMGRFHLYEGNSLLNVCSQVIIAKLLGIEEILLTNAAGGLNPTYNQGDIVLVSDFLNFTKYCIYDLLDKNNSIIKINFDIIDKELINKLDIKLINSGINAKSGTYLIVTGPNYETRSEIRMLRRIGADLVGMSTYFEALLAKILGIRVVVVSLITNKSKEIKQVVTHQEVTDIANINSFKIRKVINSFIEI